METPKNHLVLAIWRIETFQPKGSRIRLELKSQDDPAIASQTLPARENIPPSEFESEIALIIKDGTDHTRKELAKLQQILEFDLRPKPPRIIRDTYYDTSENSLRQRKISFRTRKLGGTMLIATKSDVRRISGNIIRRRETELPWSLDSVRLLARTLRLSPLKMSISEFRRNSASRTLASIGLNVIQERRTRREARDVVERGKIPASTLAELALDRVTYYFQDLEVGLSEIEVEAKSPGSLPLVQQIASSLISKHQPILQQWFHGKFVTGLAIGKLLKIEALQRHLVKGNLGPNAFDVIDRTI
ncbi:MAG TPA: CYTH domain-containing protein [Candidatus Angelobacter sp.]|nr:CYTH domain-containing protein [Candidatus Angelobacter sp.]